MDLRQHLCVGTPHGLSLEERVHVLQRDTLGLRDEEEYEGDRQEHQTGEEEVHAVVHLGEHLRREARDEEVPEPVGPGGARLGQRPDVGIEHLRVDDPGCAVPGWRVERRPQVEEEDGCDTAPVEVVALVVGRVHDFDVCTHNPHADGSAGGTDQQQQPAADVVDKVQQPDDCHYSLDHAEDARGQKAGAVAFQPDALEHGRAVVVDGVDAGPVLPEEEHATEEQPVQDTLVRPGFLERPPEAKPDRGALVLQGLVNGPDLLNHVDMVGGDLADPAEVLDGLLAAATQEQPARRLFDEEKADNQKARWNQLDGKGDQPLLVAGSHGLLHSVLLESAMIVDCRYAVGDTYVDPETHETADLPS